jgi:predicted DCC family thiol-disulfide oxidoreductase YuxK
MNATINTALAPFTILLDGQCPLCKREGAFLARLDAGRDLIRLVDIADPGFDASKYRTTFAQAMGAIHGVLPDGRLLKGMEVFRHAYTLLGKGWLVRWTGWPVVKPICDLAYRAFAKVRPRLSSHGREACASGRCRVQ